MMLLKAYVNIKQMMLVILPQVCIVKKGCYPLRRHPFSLNSDFRVQS